MQRLRRLSQKDLPSRLLLSRDLPPTCVVSDIQKMSASSPWQWPSLRRALLKIHDDLLIVHEGAAVFILDNDLNLTEQLIIILEDRRFFDHRGIDIISVIRELLRASFLMRHGGASTIDMQWVRTMTGYQERSLRRKFYEMLLALLIQQRYDKWTIFKSYMKTAYMGTRLKGIEQASLHVFGKSSDMLEFDEAAEIAAMFVYPRPSVETPRWRLKLERRKSYAKLLYPSNKQRFEKLPRRKIL